MIKSVKTSLDNGYTSFSKVFKGETFVFGNTIYKKIDNVVKYPVVIKDTEAESTFGDDYTPYPPQYNAIRVNDLGLARFDGSEDVRPVDIVLDISVLYKYIKNDEES